MQLNFFQNSMLVLLFLSYISDKVGKASDWEARRFTGFSFLTNEKSLTFSRIHPDFLEIHLNFSGIHLHFLEIYLNFFDIHLHLSESGFIFRNSSSFFGIPLHFSEFIFIFRNCPSCVAKGKRTFRSGHFTINLKNRKNKTNKIVQKQKVKFCYKIRNIIVKDKRQIKNKQFENGWVGWICFYFLFSEGWPFPDVYNLYHVFN